MSLYTVLGPALISEWDARQAATLFEDNGASDACEDGDSVAVWATTANGSHATIAAQATGGNRPLYVPDVGDGKPGVDFTRASAHYMEAAHHANLNPSLVDLIVVATADDVSTGYGGLVQKTDGSWGAEGYGLVFGDSGNHLLFTGEGGYNRREAVVSSGLRYVLWARATVVTPNAGTLLFGSARSPGGSYHFDGRLHHVLVCSALTLGQGSDALHHLMTDWAADEALILDYRSIQSPPALSGGGGSGGGVSRGRCQ